MERLALWLPPLCVVRVYKPAHNIAQFRYLECSRLDEHGQPLGEITNWEQIQFAFDDRLWDCGDLSRVSVERMRAEEGVLAREEYTCDANGNVRVHTSSLPSGKTREFAIGKMV